MRTIIQFLLSIIIFNSTLCYAQKTYIEYKLNEETIDGVSENAFKKFIGEWTLKNYEWTQNWGSGTERIKIPQHHTISTGINTKNSLLSIIDGPKPNGHIFWSYNPNTKEIHHLSSFGELRAGQGKGTFDENGDIELQLCFEGEPKDTYRIYTYKWLNSNEYHMKSVQFSKNGEPTGLFYEGSFVRFQNETTEAEILHHGEVIRKAFSEGNLEKIKALHHPEVIKALSYNNVKTGRIEVVSNIEETLTNYNLEFVENEVESILIRGDIAIEQAKFSIRGTPKSSGEPFLFKGRTMVTYVRFEKSPTGWATIREIIQPATQ